MSKISKTQLDLGSAIAITRPGQTKKS